MVYKILERKIFKDIERYLFTDDIIVLHGARQVGKTSIIQHFISELNNKNENTFYIDLENLDYLEMLNLGVNELIKHLNQQSLLKGKLFLFIDEIQYLSNPSNFLKLIHDHQKNIKLIVSGSSSFDIKNKFKDSLVGRTINFEIFPLSFEEFLIFKNEKINLSEEVDLVTEKKLIDLYSEFVIYGGYPKIVITKDVNMKKDYLQQIIDTYIRKDIKDLANIRDVLKFNKLIHILASQSGNLLNVSELSSLSGLNKSTVENYLFIMENTYIIKLVYPYSKNLRNELFKTPKIFFLDTGIAHLLKFKLFPKLVLGEYFETSIFCDLIKKYGINNINYWRTQDKKEIDFVLNKENVIPYEVKLNSSQFNNTAIDYFLEKYNLEKWFCVTLNKDKKYVNYIYPWGI